MRSTQKDSKQDRPRRKRGIWARIARALMAALDVVAVVALLLAGYAGMVSPLKHGGVWGIVGLTFPIVFLSVLVLFVVQLFWHRRGLVILGAGMVLCAGPILTFCPLNVRLRAPESAPGDSTFTILAYNTANIIDQRPDGTYDSTYNAMIAYILERDADIVCLSEAAALGVNDSLHITTAQFDSLSARYPHILMTGYAQATLSKFPISHIHIPLNAAEIGNGDIGVFRVTLPTGRLLTLFNVHLQSLGLNDGDKELYMDLTEMHRENLGDVRSRLLGKIARANVLRAKQAQFMLGVIRHYGGSNVIICGDFNDVPDCYAIRAFEGAGFSSVYPELGFGPIVTFNANRFYFGIDHILYRGALKPLTFHKGSLRASDHYPVEARFEIMSE